MNHKKNKWFRLCSTTANITTFGKTLFIVLFLVSLTSCADWFQGKVAMDTETEIVDLTKLFNYSSDTVVLESPEQVFASEGIYSNKIVVRWKDVENASSYIIERAVISPDEDGNYASPQDEDFEILNSYVYATKYEDTILSSPSYNDVEYSYKYYYRIAAQNIGKGYTTSDFSDISVESTKACGYLYAPPQNLTAWKGKSTSEIQVSWQASSENTLKYEIYRGFNEDGSSMEKVDTVSASSTSYTHEISSSNQGVEFYYKVVALNENGEESAKSSIAMGYSLMEGSPASPDNVKVVDGFGTSTKSLTISWDSVSIANYNGATGTAYYNIYRSSSADSTVSLIKSRTTSTSYIDSSSLSTSLYYYYYVMTIAVYDDGTELKSGFSDSGADSENPAYGFLLSPPTTITVDDGNDDENVILKWKPSLGYNLITDKFTYNVYSLSTLTENPTLRNANVPSDLDENGYISLEVEKYNYYKIKTLNAAGLESTYSSAASPQPSAPQNVTATKNAQISESWIANANGVYPVKITWDSPSDGDTSSYSYVLYRSTLPDSEFKKVGTTSELYYIDSYSGAKAGVMYYYKVVSLNIQGYGTHSNNPASDTNFSCRGYGALTADQWFREYNKTIMRSQAKLTLMHKSSDTDKLGTETIKGDVSGSLTYKSNIAGLGAEIKMPYTDYADFYCGDGGTLYFGNVNGYGSDYNSLSSEQKNRCVLYFLLNGSTDTSCNMSANGSMSNSVTCKGMYPGVADYNNLKIVSGAAGGGYYGVTTYDNEGNSIFDSAQVSWTVGEESTGYGWGE